MTESKEQIIKNLKEILTKYEKYSKAKDAYTRKSSELSIYKTLLRIKGSFKYIIYILLLYWLPAPDNIFGTLLALIYLAIALALGYFDPLKIHKFLDKIMNHIIEQTAKIQSEIELEITVMNENTYEHTLTETLPPKYANIPAAYKIYEYFINCRVDNIKEAVNLYEKEAEFSQLENNKKNTAKNTLIIGSMLSVIGIIFKIIGMQFPGNRKY